MNIFVTLTLIEFTMVLAMSATSGQGSTLSCNNARQVFVNMLPYDVEKRLDKDDEDDTRLRELSSLFARPSIPSLGPGLSRFAAKVSSKSSRSVFKQELKFVHHFFNEFLHLNNKNVCNFKVRCALTGSWWIRS